MNSFDESIERGTRSYWSSLIDKRAREMTLPWNSRHFGSWCFTVHLHVSTIEHHEEILRCYHSLLSLLVFLCFCTDLAAPKDSMYHSLNIIITLYSWLYKAHIISPYSQQTGSGNWYPRWRFPWLFLSLPLLASWQWHLQATFVARPRWSMRACIIFLKAKMMEQRYVHLINPFVWSISASLSLFDASFIVANHCFSRLGWCHWKLSGNMGTTCKCFAKRWECSRQQSGPD